MKSSELSMSLLSVISKLLSQGLQIQLCRKLMWIMYMSAEIAASAKK